MIANGPGVEPRSGEAPGGVAGPLVVGASHAVFELREPDDSSVRTAAYHLGAIWDTGLGGVQTVAVR